MRFVPRHTRGQGIEAAGGTLGFRRLTQAPVNYVVGKDRGC